MDSRQKATVEGLLDKAFKAGDAGQACGFSQAACNAANALRVLADIERADKAPQS